MTLNSCVPQFWITPDLAPSAQLEMSPDVGSAWSFTACIKSSKVGHCSDFVRLTLPLEIPRWGPRSYTRQSVYMPCECCTRYGSILTFTTGAVTRCQFMFVDKTVRKGCHAGTLVGTGCKQGGDDFIAIILNSCWMACVWRCPADAVLRESLPQQMPSLKMYIRHQLTKTLYITNIITMQLTVRTLHNFSVSLAFQVS